jgi:hypothetical protein
MNSELCGSPFWITGYTSATCPAYSRVWQTCGKEKDRTVLIADQGSLQSISSAQTFSKRDSTAKPLIHSILASKHTSSRSQRKSEEREKKKKMVEVGGVHALKGSIKK